MPINSIWNTVIKRPSLRLPYIYLHVENDAFVQLECFPVYSTNFIVYYF